MLTVFLCMLFGAVLGFLFRTKRLQCQNIITYLIWVLLLGLGIEVGSNKDLISGLFDLGGEALLLALGGTLGSLLTALWLWRCVSHPDDKKEVS